MSKLRLIHKQWKQSEGVFTGVIHYKRTCFGRHIVVYVLGLFLFLQNIHSLALCLLFYGQHKTVFQDNFIAHPATSFANFSIRHFFRWLVGPMLDRFCFFQLRPLHFPIPFYSEKLPASLLATQQNCNVVMNRFVSYSRGWSRRVVRMLQIGLPKYRQDTK
jgi:hypothetical protein